MIRTSTAVVVAIAMAAPCAALGQGLAAAAQKEKERRAKVQSTAGPSKTYTDDAPPPPPPAASPSPASDQKPPAGRAPITPQERRRLGGRAAIERAERAVSVTVYLTSWCQYCRKTLQFLGTVSKISVATHDIEKDPAGRARMLRLTGGDDGVPVIDVEGTIIRGYSPEEMVSAIERARAR